MFNKTKALFKSLKEFIIQPGLPPERIALSFAIGMFIGTAPLFGTHTLLIIALVSFFKNLHRVIMLSASQITFPLWAGLIYWIEYEVGRNLVPGIPQLSKESFNDLSFRILEQFFYPLFVGWLTFGLFLAILSFFIVYKLAMYYHNRTKKVK